MEMVCLLCRCRMPAHQVYFYRSPYHNDHYVLTLSFCFDKEEEAYQFAYSYPYSYSKCQAYLELIERKPLPHFKRELFGNSLVIHVPVSIGISVSKHPKTSIYL